MSKKHPGRDTDYAKWISRMAKLDNVLKKEQEKAKKAETNNGSHKGHKRLKEEEETI